MLTTGTELARAKVNLALGVLGRRPDGFHELATLIAFADAGDRIALAPGAEPGVAVQGPFAAAIIGENLLARTLDLLAHAAPQLALGRVTLTKELPVAAGLGGGSADEAALLRAVRAANPDRAETVDWRGIAARLGADVPVCLVSKAAWVGGFGDEVTPLEAPLPPLDVILANPLAPVPADKTAQVFRRLGAPPLAERQGTASPSLAPLSTRAELIAFMSAHGNALEAAARAVVPEVGEVLAALAALPGAMLTRLSGAGPTCFAVFEDRDAAAAAAASLAAERPRWWVRAAVLAD